MKPGDKITATIEGKMVEVTINAVRPSDRPQREGETRRPPGWRILRVDDIAKKSYSAQGSASLRWEQRYQGVCECGWNTMIKPSYHLPGIVVSLNDHWKQSHPGPC